MASWLKASGLALGLVFTLLGGCKQGVNEVCQVSSDCADGLVCNSNTGLCQESQGTVTPDASPNVDAPETPTPDAATPDAATPDAATPVPDAATPVPDAMPIDAAP